MDKTKEDCVDIELYLFSHCFDSSTKTVTVSTTPQISKMVVSRQTLKFRPNYLLMSQLFTKSPRMLHKTGNVSCYKPVSCARSKCSEALISLC